MYYPGVATVGCKTAALTINGAYTITNPSTNNYTATFTLDSGVNNTLIVGQQVKIADTTAFNSASTYAVTAVTADVPASGPTAEVPATFTVSYATTSTITTGSGTDTGTATPTCYNYPTSDINGNFNLAGDYSTSSVSSTAICYIMAIGGNPQGPNSAPSNNNPNLALAAPLGLCSGLASQTVNVNEITTAAMAFAMGQYFTPTFGGSAASGGDSFGTPNTTQAQLGIGNAYATVGNLVSISTGLPVISATVSDSNTPSTVGTITITPESTKLYTIANILAACVNTLGVNDPGLTAPTPCTKLFAAVTPTHPIGTTTGTAVLPTDTLQMAVYMSLNPTSTNATVSSTNISTLMSLGGASKAYNTILSTNPTEWTLGITYGSNTTLAGASIYLIRLPYNVAVDASGNVWMTNGTASSNDSVTELSGGNGGTATPGTPLKQVLTASGNIQYPQSIVIDPSNNVWVANNATSGFVSEYTAGGTVNTFPTATYAASLASDGAGNIAVVGSGTTGVTSLQVIPQGSLTGTTATSYNLALGSGVSAQAYPQVAVDNNDNLWLSCGTAVTSTCGVAKFAYSATGATLAVNITGGGGTGATAVANVTSGSIASITVTNGGSGYTTSGLTATVSGGGGTSATLGTPAIASGAITSIGVSAGGSGYTAAYPTTPVYTTTTVDTAADIVKPYPLAIDSNNHIWVGNYSTATNGTLAVIANPTTAVTGTSGYATAKSVTMYPGQLVMDGASNVWLADRSGSTSNALVSEYSNAGVTLSPVGGFVHTYNTPPSIAIDPSGNVWVGSEQTANSTTQSFITEIVGAAVPVVTPIAAGLPATVGGTNLLGTKP